MEINNSIKEVEVMDYDFAFTNGMRISQSLEPNTGDYAEELADRYILHLSEKPSKVDPDELIPAEDVTVFKDQVVVLINRKRMMKLPTEQELFDMKEILHKIPKSIN